MSNDQGKIRITWDDVNKAELDPPTPVTLPLTRPVRSSGDGSWGSISPQPNAAAAMATSGGGNVLMKGWFYLGAAGLVGAFLAWMFCEPSFEDGAYSQGWGNTWIFPLMVILMSIGFGSAECFVERTWKRAFLRGLASTGLGLVFGFVFYRIGDVVYNILLHLVVNLGTDADEMQSNPLFWLARALAWAVNGMAGGLIFGIVSKSAKKTTYGMIGGVIGAAIGGLLFDPISGGRRGQSCHRDEHCRREYGHRHRPCRERVEGSLAVRLWRAARREAVCAVSGHRHNRKKPV